MAKKQKSNRSSEWEQRLYGGRRGNTSRRAREAEALKVPISARVEDKFEISPLLLSRISPAEFPSPSSYHCSKVCLTYSAAHLLQDPHPPLRSRPFQPFPYSRFHLLTVIEVGGVPDMMSASEGEGAHGKADVVKEVAEIL